MRSENDRGLSRATTIDIPQSNARVNCPSPHAALHALEVERTYTRHALAVAPLSNDMTTLMDTPVAAPVRTRVRGRAGQVGPSLLGLAAGGSGGGRVGEVVQDGARHMAAQLDDDLGLLGRRRAAALEHARERGLGPPACVCA